MRMKLSDRIAMYFAVQEFLQRRDEIYDDMAEALDDGDPLMTFIMSRYERALATRSALASLYARILSRLSGGSFTTALTDMAPASDLMILEASERTGEMPDGLRFLADAVRQQRVMRKTLTGALAQPSVLFVIIMVIMLGFAAYLTPILVQVVPVEKWPLPGRIARNLSQTLYDHFWFLATLSLGGGSWFIYTLPRWTGRGRMWADRVLPWSVYRDFNGAMFLVAFSGQVRHGVGVKEALVSLRMTASPWLSWQIGHVLQRLDRFPDQPGKALNSGLFSPELALRIEDFARRSTFEVALHKVGQSVIERTTARVKVAAQVGNQILLMLAGGLLALMIVGTMLIGQAARTEAMSTVTQRPSMR